MKKSYLMTPGPTPVPTEALLAMAKPIIHHRTGQFMKVLEEAVSGLKYVMQTENDVFIFTSSGTGAMESAVSNVLSPGDKALVVNGGKFGERWGELCKAFGAEAIIIDCEWGKAVDPKIVESKLKQNPDIKAVYATLCETSTGVINDIEAIGKVVAKTQAILVVDSISGLGAVECKTDAWLIDINVSGSQKGLMIPPGLAFVSVSKKAWKTVEQAKNNKYYFSYKAAKKSADNTDTPWTPAVSLVVALVETLKIIKTETLEKILERHKKMAAAVRAAASALKLKLLAPNASSDAVTAMLLPESVDGEKLVKTMRDEYGVGVAGGQDKLKGKICRIATMGFMTEFDVIVAIACLEVVLKKMGYGVELGSGVKAAQEVLFG
ncbi:MAG: alanine--glyoxylate aminotransferase family protein [Candidatus Omnitrophota bacterium]